MVTVAMFGDDIDGSIMYNERKVHSGVATCLEAVGFGIPASELTLAEKRKRFKEITDRNLRAEKNCVHISISFHPSESIDSGTMCSIASDYMDLVGLGSQPYLLYEHNDTAHPHMHIVTTNIRANGNRIDTHFFGAYKSEPARMELEERYGLVKAKGRELDYFADLQPIDIEVADYGEVETKAAISRIVRKVVSNYRFESLEELNAVLRQFNVVADPGSEGSRIKQHGGLLYSLLDRYGGKKGKSIKASSIFESPTLSKLEKLYSKKKFQKEKYRGRLVKVIEDCLKLGPTEEEFAKLLLKAKVSIQWHRNADQFAYGVTFVDNLTRTVFKGSDLRKGYSAMRLIARIKEGTDPEVLYNRLFCRRVFGTTDLHRSPRSIFKSWLKAGALLVVDSSGEYPKYRMGYWASPDRTFQPVPLEISEWLYQIGIGKAMPSQVEPIDSRHNFTEILLAETGMLLDNGYYFFNDLQREMLRHTYTGMPVTHAEKKKRRLRRTQ